LGAQDQPSKQFPTAGWKLNGKPILSEKTGILNFKQGKSQLTVFIRAGDAGTAVRLILGAVQQG
jgi:hypothetical protein